MTTRRHFLQLAAGVTASGILHLHCSADDGGEITGPVAAGNLSAVPVGHLAAVGGFPVILGRDAQGLYAMSAICTHQRCDMTRDGVVSASGVNCNCHGSRFTVNGAVQAGPAGAPLQHYQVDVGSDGAITIQGGMPVAASDRTAVSA
jgi:Rieske Fe-S protein